MTIDYNLEAVH